LPLRIQNRHKKRLVIFRCTKWFLVADTRVGPGRSFVDYGIASAAGGDPVWETAAVGAGSE